jgi:hypothetical protein
MVGVRRLSVLLLMASCEPTPGGPAAGGERIRPVVLAEDGGWCWFQDERALFIGQRVVVSSVSHDGEVQVSSYDLATGDRQNAVLARLERDDHDVASLLERSDGALMAFYTRHNHDSLMRWRVSRGEGGDLSSWEPEQTFDTGVKISYSNPLQLAGEADAVYLFYRSLDISPSFSRSPDGGASWSAPARVIHSFDETRTHRPYVKYASDGADTIHLVYTDGHPNEFNGTAAAPLGNSVYHLYYRAGQLHRSDGSVVAPLVPGQGLDLAPAAGTLVHDGRDGEAFTWDLALDQEGHPVVVYATFPDESSEHATFGDHRYRYARWDGAAWHDQPVAFAGRGQTLRSKHASGGIAIDPDAVDTVYFASSVDPIAGTPAGTGAFEIYRGRTDDGGASWRFEPITSDSAIDNIRPIVPARHPTATAVLWLQGVYDEYFDSQNMRVVGLFGPAGARAGERTGEEAIAMAARFDVGSAERASGFVAVVPDGDATATATAAGSVRLELSGVAGSEIRPRGGALHRDFVYNDRGGAAPGDKLHVRLTGLAPGVDHIVRLHQVDPEYHPLAEAYWFDGATGSLEPRGNAGFLGAHRLVNGAANGAGALALLLASDRDGAIDLVAGGAGDDSIVVLNGVEVARRPASDLIARFDIDCATAANGSFSAGGLTLTVRSDRPDCPREDAATGDGEVVAELAGLEPGRVYEITATSVDAAAGDGHASMWWLEEEGSQPVVVRAFHFNGASAGPAASFTFYHRAAEPTAVLRGHDLIRADRHIDSAVILNGLEIRRLR